MAVVPGAAVASACARGSLGSAVYECGLSFCLFDVVAFGEQICFSDLLSGNSRNRGYRRVDTHQRARRRLARRHQAQGRTTVVLTRMLCLLKFGFDYNVCDYHIGKNLASAWRAGRLQMHKTNQTISKKKIQVLLKYCLSRWQVHGCGFRLLLLGSRGLVLL
jgi:hypothetical protein